MKIKDLANKISHSLNKRQREQKKIEQGIVAVQNVYDESKTKKEANKKAINIVIDTIQTHPDMRVGDFLKMVQENTDLSDSSLVEIIKQMPDIKSEKETVEVVKKVELASEAITQIIQEATVSTTTAQKLIEQIPDEEIQKEQQAEIEKRVKEERRKKQKEEEIKIISNLEKIYENCDRINDAILVEEINELGIKVRTEKINEKLKNIIAKKVALDCMEFGGPKLPTMMRIMPATEMLETNLPVLAENEYHKMKSIYDKKRKRIL